MTQQETIGLIDELIETNKDGELGYRTAALHVHNTQLQSVFTDYAKQRAQFAHQLRAEIERLGGTPADSGSFAAALYRGWIDVKTALSGGDGSSLIAACEAGDEAAVASYQRVIAQDISGQTRTIIERQFRQVQEAHNHMCRLKEGNERYQKNEVDQKVEV